MQGIDTNILVRYVIQDDADQAAASNKLLEGMLTSSQRCLVNNIVLCEMVWVLKSAYGCSKMQIVDALKSITDTAPFEFEDRSVLLSAIQDYETSKADFSDCLLNRQNQQLGCTETFSFDKGVAGLTGFTVL